MNNDLAIAQAAQLEDIYKIGEKAGIPADALEPYGRDKAKISQEFINSCADRKDGKLILVTAITPTKAGEGKSTTTIGLADGLSLIGKNVIAALREPSSDRSLVSRAALPAAVMPRLCRWNPSTFTLPVICMQSPHATT